MFHACQVLRSPRLPGARRRETSTSRIEGCGGLVGEHPPDGHDGGDDDMPVARRHLALTRPRRSSRLALVMAAGWAMRHSPILPLAEGALPVVTGKTSKQAASVIPPGRAGYLAEIAATVRGYHEQTGKQSAAVRRVQRLAAVRAELDGDAERAVATLLDQATARSPKTAPRCCAPGRTSPPPILGTNRSPTSGTKSSARRRPAGRCPGTRSPGWRCRATKTTGNSCGSCATRTCPVTSPSPPGCSHSSGKGKTRPGCSPGGDPFRTNRPVQAVVRRQRGDPAVHRVRLGHPLRPRPWGEPGRVRQGGHLRRLDRDPG